MSLRTANPLRAALRVRALHTSRAVFNASSEFQSAERQIVDKEIEITESKRRHVEGVHKGEKYNTKYNKNRDDPRKQERHASRLERLVQNGPRPDQAQEQPTDFFESLAGPSSSRTKPVDAGIDMNLLLVDEGVSDLSSGSTKSKGKSPKQSAGSRDRQGQRQGRAKGQNKKSGVREGKAQREASRKEGRSGKAIYQPREVVREAAVFDTSFSALFGQASIISPPRRGARDAEASYWAKDVSASDARKADLLRLAGSYDLRLPSSPLPSALGTQASPAEKAKATARWALAANQSMTMRALNPGLAAVDRLLR